MFSDPEALDILVGAMIVAALVTGIVARLLGRRIARHSLVLARFVAAFAAPALTFGFSIVRFRIDSGARPLSDWPGTGRWNSG